MIQDIFLMPITFSQTFADDHWIMRVPVLYRMAINEVTGVQEANLMFVCLRGAGAVPLFLLGPTAAYNLGVQ